MGKVSACSSPTRLTSCLPQTATEVAHPETLATTPCSFISFGCRVDTMSALSNEERVRVRAALGRTGGRPRITTEDGDVIDLPEPVAEAMAEVLEAAADGERPLVLRSPDNLTTEQAAAILNVSRPTVVRWIEAGKLPARMVGTRRRLTLGDVLAFRGQSTKRRRRALDE